MCPNAGIFSSLLIGISMSPSIEQRDGNEGGLSCTMTVSSPMPWMNSLTRSRKEQLT
ncbi:hypothetical protein X975_25416, partial [Stegodyphus mimosarum]